MMMILLIILNKLIHQTSSIYVCLKYYDPDKSYQFLTIRKRNLKFQFNWFSRWELLVYSKTKDGVYSKY